MGRSVKVEISGREFASKKAAVSYYMDLREAVKETGPLKDGEFFEELKDLYVRYCEATKFELNGRVIYGFGVDYEPRQSGQTWASHLCYWVHFSPKQKLSFSVREAVDAIVKAEAGDKL